MQLPRFVTEIELHELRCSDCGLTANYILPETHSALRPAYACSAHLIEMTLRRAGITRIEYQKPASR